jgi:hypothetical protein
VTDSWYGCLVEKMNEKKQPLKSRLLGRIIGASEASQSHRNAVELLRSYAAKSPEGWFYVEGMVTSTKETFHHAWVAQGGDLLDPTLPDVELEYRELRRWPAAEILLVVEQDIELPLADELGQVRSASGYCPGE